MKTIKMLILIVSISFVSCSHDKSLWKESMEKNSINSYSIYLDTYPSGDYAFFAKRNISNLIIKMIKDRYFEKSYFPSSKTDYPYSWNGLPFDVLKTYIISYDGEMGIHGEFKPIKGESTFSLNSQDQSFNIECLYTLNGSYKMTHFRANENSVVQMKSGKKYKYWNYQFVEIPN